MQLGCDCDTKHGNEIFPKHNNTHTIRFWLRVRLSGELACSLIAWVLEPLLSHRSHATVTLSPFTSNLLMNEMVEQITCLREKRRVTGGGCGGPRHPFALAVCSRQPRFTVSFAWNEIFLPLPSSSMAGKRLEMQRDHNYDSHVTALTNMLGMANITPVQLAQGLITVCHVEMNVI